MDNKKAIILELSFDKDKYIFPCSISDSYIIAQERFSFQKILIIISSLLNPMLTFPLLIMGQGAVSVAICMTAITVIKLLCGTVYCIKKLNISH